MIQKELEKIKERNKAEFQNGEEHVAEIKMLLENNAQEELQALKALGMTNSIDHIEDRKGRFLERESFESQYGKVFTEDEIKELCINYNLRFLPSKRYSGPISAEIGAVIVRFCKKNNISLSNGAYGYSFRIVAPKSYFNLDERESFSARMKRLKEQDPLLFFEIKPGHYSLIHQWGNTFTYLRYIGSFFNRSGTHSGLSSFCFSFAFFSFLFTWIAGIGVGPIVASSLMSSIGVLAFYLTACNDTDLFGNRFLYFSDEVWDKSHKR